MPPTEAEQAEGQPILGVEVVGNRRVTRKEIESFLQWLRKGKPFSPKGMTRDVRELWDSTYFEDIQVDLTREGQGVRLRILVRERPAVKAFEFKGNHELDEEDLSGIVTGEVKTGSIISHAAIRRAVQKIRDKYAEEGFFLAEARYEVIPQKNNEVTVRFTVKEHEKVSVRRVTFIGNHHVSDDELREIMVTGRGGFFDFGSGGPFRQDAFERDVILLSAIYYDRGFLSVQIAAPRVMLTPDRSGIDIVVSIDEGPRYRIRRLAVMEVDADGREIDPLGGRRGLREMVRARPGEYFNRAELARDLAAIQTMYRDHGYANVEAPPQTQLFPDAREVDIAVKVRRHGLVRFGRIEIRGNTKTRDKVIRRELEIEEGKLYSETGLEESRRRVTMLGYFERVDVSTEQGDDPARLDVNIEVVEKPTGTFQIGAGFSSIESFIATAQIQQANLFGNGQSRALMAQLSGLRQLVDIRFYEPYLLDSPFSLSVDLFDQLRVYDQFALDSTGGSLAFGYPLIDPELSASLTYTLKSDQVDTRTTSTFFGTASAVSVFQRLPLANLFNDGLTSSIRPALTYDTRDNRLFPTSGVYLQASTEVAVTALGSENEYLRHRAVGRFYYPFTPTVVLKFNAEAGLVTSPSDEGVPLFARFFLGGIFDLRGYRLRTVGPRLPLRSSLDENAPPIRYGANIGGNLMYFQNLELEIPIVQPVGLRGVIFTDLGNVWNLEDVFCQAAPSAAYAVTDPCFELGHVFDVRSSWGFGLRWFSPLGPLRFEWGFPFKTLPYEETSVFEFTIGNFF
ncbi:MAG: outer membrane protein assembly factor BamA [Deltaproteobacteria bacterium]|nr:outer membrane protein assembly factor BamA [Deltaproteobacteria bacterium]